MGHYKIIAKIAKDTKQMLNKILDPGLKLDPLAEYGKGKFY